MVQGFPPKYDAAGNVTCDGYDSGTGTCHGNEYLYDGDGRICAIEETMSPYKMMGYLYDAEGRRVGKGTLTSFSCNTATNGFTLSSGEVLSLDGRQLTEYGGSTAQPLHTNVWAAGQLMATDTLNQSPVVLNYEFEDWLGTRRVLTDSAGNIDQTCPSLPYGNGEPCPTTPTEHLFTQHERDAETNNDYFGARYYASGMGRFISPDWSDDPEAVPYADFEDPQSLNLYGYAGNNPFVGIDSDGHFHCDPDTTTSSINEHGYLVLTVTPGACHADASDFWDFGLQLIGIPPNVGDVASQAVQQFANIMRTPGGGGCLGKATLGGAMVGGSSAALPGLVGLAGGPAVLVTEPSAVGIGTAGGAGSGFMLGMTFCQGGASSGGGSGGGSTDGRKPPVKAIKLKGSQGWRDEAGNIWKKDMLHKDHWDVSDRTGTKIKEVTFDGRELWPNGPKNSAFQP